MLIILFYRIFLFKKFKQVAFKFNKKYLLIKIKNKV